MRFNIIVAISNKNGIGKGNQIPWFLKSDLAHFKKVTTNTPSDDWYNYVNMVIMGRNTWESIPNNRKPLPNRINIILTSRDIDIDPTWNSDIIKTTPSLKSALQLVDVFNNSNTTFPVGREKIQNTGDESNAKKKINRIYQVFVIGGERPYKEAINYPNCDRLYLTEVYDTFDCDRFFPSIKDIENNKFSIVNCSDFRNENNINYRFVEYRNNNFITSSNELYCNQEETNYLDLMRRILETGIERSDRTGVGTLSVFGEQLKFNLRDTFPMSTTKKMFFRAIFEELMLYLRGQTDNKILNAKRIHIWDGNTSREFLDKRGLNHYNEGDMGETYGFNFRHFGGEYKGCQHKYDSNVGFDQLNYVIDLIKNNPTSRRIIINLWNPKTLHKATLPSCLCKYQFYVDTIRKELNLQIYLRSSDFFLANNWNTCTGALLVHLLCNLQDIDLTPGILTVVVGDTHLYKNHIEQVRKNLERVPYPFPKLIIKNQKNNIEDFVWKDLQIIGYKSYPRIPAPMAV